MGAACCCLRDDFDDFASRSSSVYRNCICLRFLVQNLLMNVCTLLFHRRNQSALPSSAQGVMSLSPGASFDHSLTDTHRATSRPLPYDADQRYFRLQRDGLVSRREKGSSHSQEETEPLRSAEVTELSESLGSKKKWNEFSSENESKEYKLKSSLNLSECKATAGFSHLYTTSEDEDVCPTCLDEYSTENPKIVTKCSHHFHLGCIYEWMERSDNCPVCGKEMAFDETP